MCNATLVTTVNVYEPNAGFQVISGQSDLSKNCVRWIIV